MPKIDRKLEENYLDFVIDNIQLRKDELVYLSTITREAVADNKSLRSLNEDYRKRTTPDPQNPYFIRVDLVGGEIRYYGFDGLRQNEKSDAIPVSHAGVDGILVRPSHADGKGYTADYAENLPDLLARTRFIIKNGQIQKISEEIFAEDVEPNRVIASEVLEETIQQTREQKMHPIASTLQPDQFKITREPLTHSLAIQGPPGSGKTAVLLERLSRLAFADEKVRNSGMMLVGPNAAFMEYVSQVLPTLGKSDISLQDVESLSPFAKEATSTKVESEDLIYLKGSSKMQDLALEAVSNLVQVIPNSSLMRVYDLTVTFTPLDSLNIIKDLMENHSDEPYAQKRRIAETRIKNLLAERLVKDWEGAGRNLRTLQGDPAQLISQESAYKTLIRNMFPNQDPLALMIKLRSDASYFYQIATNILELEEIELWINEIGEKNAPISKYDVPIVDYLYQLMVGKHKVWGHIAVDETQDLTEMQLQMISNRIEPNGTFSLAGDLAQATGIQYYDSWDAIAAALNVESDFSKRNLVRSYRVPSEILNYSQQFLESSRVTVDRATPFLDIKDSLQRFVFAQEDIYAEVVSLAQSELELENSVLILIGEQYRSRMNSEKFNLGERSYVRIMDPLEVKGLEFDTVILVDPKGLANSLEWGKSRIARLLYVLTTRSTKKLLLVGTDLNDLQSPIADLEDEEFEVSSELEDSYLTDLGEYAKPVFGESLPSSGEPDLMDRLEKFFPGFKKRVKDEGLFEPVQSASNAIDEFDLELTSDLEIPTQNFGVSDYCRQSDKPEIARIQSDESFNTGSWFFAGLTQTRCYECNSKPQLLFMRHTITTAGSNTHKWGLGCQDCAVVSHGMKYSKEIYSAISKELEIEKSLNHLCLGCGDKA